MSTAGDAKDPTSAKSVMIIDDDYVHLQLYGWMLRHAGHRPLLAQVFTESVDLKSEEAVDIVLIDYLFKSSLKAPQVARMVKEIHPQAEMVVLSQMEWMPDDMATFSKTFFPKNDPGRLMEYLKSFTKVQKP